MSIYTPRGLKVRLDPLYAFALMARLEPEIPPFRVLQTTEAVENAPSALALIAAVIAVTQHQTPTAIAVWTAAAGVLAATLTTFGIFIIPGMVAVGHVFSRIAGFGIMFIAFTVFAWFYLGWRGAAGYVAGRAAMAGINSVIEMQRGRYYYRMLGHPFTVRNQLFFRLQASRPDSGPLSGSKHYRA